MNKQTFFFRNLSQHDTALISAMGLDRPEGNYCHYPEWSSQRRQGRPQTWRHVCRYETFSLVAGENYYPDDRISYTEWEDYIKINFWLRGRHTTVLDGFGQHEHERPEVFIISGPRKMLKIDMVRAGTPTAVVALCLRREFFPVHLGLAWEELPEPLRSLTLPEERPYGFHQLSLTRDLVTAVRSILNAPFAVRREPVYGQAKAVELMCLLLEQMNSVHRVHLAPGKARNCRESRLREARELVAQRYSENLTLERLSREVGLNRMALTSGFRTLFGMSVHDCLKKERMERAYELLQDDAHTIAQVAEAVGYNQASTLSTAFHGYFGCTPQQARGRRLADG